jgi:hypothetical protein
MKITERGWGAHHICADRCRFRRNTLVEGLNGKVIVSTVGNFHATRDGGMHTVGCERYYETRVFETQIDGPYVDIDVSKERHDHTEGDREWAVHGKSPDELPEDVDNVANDIHEAVVKFYADLLRKA